MSDSIRWGTTVGGHGLVEDDDRGFGVLAPCYVGAGGVAGVAVDELGDHAFAPADEYMFGGVKLSVSVGAGERLYARSVWSWRYIRDLGWDEFAWWFVIVVPLTSCTVWFWVAANKNLEQLGQGPLILHESWGIWGAPLFFGLATGACLWTLYADTESLTPVVVLAALLLLVLVIATALLTQPQGSSAVWLGASFAGVIVSALTSFSLVTHSCY